jgi:hypothetical protein
MKTILLLLVLCFTLVSCSKELDAQLAHVKEPPRDSVIVPTDHTGDMLAFMKKANYQVQDYWTIWNISSNVNTNVNNNNVLLYNTVKFALPYHNGYPGIIYFTWDYCESDTTVRYYGTVKLIVNDETKTFHNVKMQYSISRSFIKDSSFQWSATPNNVIITAFRGK